MLNQKRQPRTPHAAPRPLPFGSLDERHDLRTVEAIGRALDEVVEAFLVVSSREDAIAEGDLRLLNAATHRLWRLALMALRARVRTLR